MVHGIFKQCSTGTRRTLGRCPRPRRGGGSSPNPATCGWCISQATLRSCQGNENMPLPGQAGKAGPPVRLRTGKRLGISRKTSSLVFSEIPSLFCCPGALLSIQKVPGAHCLLFQICSIAKAGPGPGGPWFGGLGAEEAPASLLPGSSLVDAESFRRILLIISNLQHRQGRSRTRRVLVRGSGG